jgi:hypothetical protein
VIPIYARAYGLASLARLSLPDAMQTSWLPVALLHLLGAMMLLFNGCMAGWLLCLVATGSGILWLGDQLTQSAYLFFCALAALACSMAARRGRPGFLRDGLPLAVRVISIAVYACAAVHKLNRGFVDPTVSCANGGLQLLIRRGRLAEYGDTIGAALAFDSAAWPILYIGIELGVVVLLLCRPAWGVLWAAAMHLPLTIIFAPSFALVMASGWVCFFSEAEHQALAVSLRRRWLAISLFAGTGWVASQLLFFSGRWDTDPDWRIKEALVWLLLAWLVVALFRPRDSHGQSLFSGRGVWREPTPLPERWWAAVMGVLVVFNGITPYLGLQLHRTGAMLSNLRIDTGCQNSLLFPDALRVSDPYVRIDTIRFAAGRATSTSAAYITSRLWSVAGLHRARTRWCGKHPEPIALGGSHAGQSFAIDHFCAPEGWPWGEVRLQHMRRFQRNLRRKCAQRCIH